MRKLIGLMAAGLVAMGGAASGQATGSSAVADRLTPDRVYENPDLTGPRARGVKISPDGTAVTYLKARADDQRMTDLWIADVKGGAPRLLIDAKSLIPEGRTLSEAEKSRRERAGVQTRGVVDYAWDDEGRFILVPVEGDLWLYERKTGKTRQLTDTTSDEIDAKVSPKGGYVSFVRSDNLFVVPAAGGFARALTDDGSDLRSWGTAEFIAEEEMDRHTGYWWSPDDTRIALTHVDVTGVDIVERTDIGPEGSTVVRQRYPRTGRPNAKVDLWIANVADGSRIQADLGDDADVYLARVDWAKDGRTLYVQRQSRDQRTLDLLAIDPATGKGRVILTQKSPHWVELNDDFRPLKDSSFLSSSEEGGWRHLYLHAADGKVIRQVTSGEWPMAGLLSVDEKRGVAIFAASADNPTERRIYEVSYRKTGKPVALTPAGGWWTADVARSGQAFAATYEDPSTPPRTGLFKAGGKLVRWIEENRLDASHPMAPYMARFRAPQFGTIKAADGQDLWWSMRTPPGFDPARKYPVIVQIYGGPTATGLVRKVWYKPEDQLFLEAGFILFTLDNRGTGNRSVAFKTAIDRAIGTVEIDDQFAGVEYLKSLPYVDGGRIGVMGWSYGGFMTLMLLTAPDSPYAAGVAGAAPTDWRLYDTHYTERYLGTPASDKAAYDRSEITERLDRLGDGRLLLMHGMADDNVTFDNATRVMAALEARDTAFEQMLYPGLRHRAGWTQSNLKHRTETQLDYFVRKLKPEPAP